MAALIRTIDPATGANGALQGGVVPIGGVLWFGATSAPTGYLKANGATISRTTYAALFDVIGTTFGAGDGSTTFAIPDLRGEFVRGYDDSRGIDSGRVFGSLQTDAFQGHYHGPDGTIRYDGGAVAGGPYPCAAGSTVSIGAPTSDGTHGTPRTASETRPRNVALLPCIKY